MAEALHQFGNILLGSRGGTSQGQLKIGSGGLVWRRATGGKTVEVKKDDVSELLWTKTSRGCQLGVRPKEGATINFLGFKDKDYDSLAPLFKASYGTDLVQRAQATAGHNWGNVKLAGSSLQFMVDGKVAFEVPLPDVSQAQNTRDEVMLEFHVDDTADGDKEDTLVEMAFHVPAGNEEFAPAAEAVEGEDGAVQLNQSAAVVLLNELQQHTEADAGSSDEAVCIFDDVAVLAPRGRFEVEMHGGFLKMTGQTQDFKIRYASIVRLFILPKNSSPHTLVVISLDPPIRKGQTYYSHLLCQFPFEVDIDIELDITDDMLAAKNEKCGNRLQRKMSGRIADVFAKTLRGLSAAKITKAGGAGQFQSASGDGPSVRCSYKSDEGYLYPLERAFFYVHKPPLLILHDDIRSVEFERQGGGVVSATARTFDLLIRTKNDAEFQFRNIQKTELQNLVGFCQNKGIRIENLGATQQGTARGGVQLDDEDDMDAGLRAAAAEAEEDESDESFKGGESSSESDEDSDASSDAELIDEEDIKVAAVSSKRAGGGGKRKAAGGSDDEGAAKPTKKAKPAAADDAGAGGGRKKRAKKDPNAPKKAMSAFMYFSQESRERIKAENPGATFGELGKLAGEQWKALAAEEKARFEELAARDKERYQAAMREYQAGAGAAKPGRPSAEDEWGADEGGQDD